MSWRFEPSRQTETGSDVGVEVRPVRRIEDKCLLGLIHRYLQAGLMADGLVSPRREGTRQGGPLSALLSNILLDDLDQELERRGHDFVRYAGNCSIFVRFERVGQVTFHRQPRLKVTPKSVRRLRLKLKTLLRQGRGRRLDRVCGERLEIRG